ncbi:MAG: PLP-dependent transferase, partial [Terriglobales bacterium]
GHEFWKRDFTGSSGVFSIAFKPKFTREQVHKFVDRLQLFKIGYSWGGVASLGMTYDFGTVKTKRPDYGHRLVRLNIGLESTADLKADITQALQAMI